MEPPNAASTRGTCHYVLEQQFGVNRVTEIYCRMPRLTALSCLLLLLGTGCARGKPAPSNPPEASSIESTSFAPELEVNLDASTKSAAGLYYRDIEPGSGPAVAAGQQVSVFYTGWLANGRQFDSNAGGSPISFRLGAREVIDGWDQGVAGMRIGGKRQLIIPAALGYGPVGSGPIPPNAILVFNVEVISAQ
jgi:FKBP-type peptidyl-prolyl cis-trans isomerase